MKKLRLRDIFNKSPFLDGLRTSLLVNVCTAGINFFDRSYAPIKIMTPAARKLLENNVPALLAMYHGRFIGLLHIVEQRRKITCLISRSRDGEMIARIAENIGYSVARGSPAFKAVEGALQLVAAAQSGQSLMITVDGPRGPIYKVKPGVIRMAEITGLPLLPFFCNFKKGEWWRTSWDHITGGYYGSPMLYLIGDPIYVPPDADERQLEETRQKLEGSMAFLRARADEFWKLKRH